MIVKKYSPKGKSCKVTSGGSSFQKEAQEKCVGTYRSVETGKILSISLFDRWRAMGKR